MMASVQIAQSLQKALNGLLGFIPNLLGFLVILIVGFVIARIVKGIVTKLLQRPSLIMLCILARRASTWRSSAPMRARRR